MDLRDYLERLRAIGDLKEIDVEVHWNLEAAAINAMNSMMGGPALLFNRVRGYPEGYRLACNLFTGPADRMWRRYAVIMGLDPDVDFRTFVQEYIRRVTNPLKPTLVATGPCKEVIHLGKEVNLLTFPWPYLHEGDGGRYGTIQTMITRDLDSDWVNWGNYRMLIHGRNKLGVLLSPGQHCSMMFYEKYEPKGVPMPFCIAVGGSPATFVAAGSYAPPGVHEVDIAGGIQGAPIELVKAETNDLLVPADAEIVIEGEVRPGERADEGPFGEFFGFMHGPRKPMPVWRVHCITHRRDPIIPFVAEGILGGDSQCLAASVWSAGLYAYLRLMKGYPVTGVYMPREFRYNLFIIAVESPTPALLQDIADALYGLGIYGYLDYIAFIDGDADPTDLPRFVEDLALRMHPVKDFHQTGWEMPRTTLNVYLSPEEQRVGLTRKNYLDLTTKEWDPSQGPKRLGPEAFFPQEVRQRAAELWQRLGLPGRPRI